MTGTHAELISEQEFNAVWKARAKPNGELFLYREIIDFPIHRVWTAYEDGSIDKYGRDDCTWFAMPGIVPGFAIGYLVTDREWMNETPHAIWYLDDDDEAREERILFNLERRFA